MSELLKINVSEQAEKLLAMAFGGQWKEHPNHNTYWFSNGGLAARVKQNERQLSVCLLVGCSCGKGYRAISCPKGGGRYQRVYIHRAVCELFVGAAPFNGAHVRHLDCNRFNNTAINLAWGSPKENAMDSVRAGKIKKGPQSQYAKLSAEEANELQKLRSSGHTFKSLGEQFGVARTTAQRVCTKDQWQ